MYEKIIFTELIIGQEEIQNGRVILFLYALAISTTGFDNTFPDGNVPRFEIDVGVVTILGISIPITFITLTFFINVLVFSSSIPAYI